MTDNVSAEPSVDESAPARVWRGRLFLALRILTVLVVGYFIVRTTVDLWADVRDTIAGLSWAVIAGATATAVASIGATMMAWRSALTDLGYRLHVRDAAEINLVGQLGKYVPGSVWAYVLQMQLARRVGVPRSRGLLASVTTTLLGVTAGVAVGSLGFRTLSADGGGAGRTVVYIALAALPFALVCSHPWVLTRVVRLMLRLTRREPLTSPLTWRGILGVLGWAVLAYVLAGVHLWLLAGTEAGTGLRGLVACTAAFALAMIAGTFAFFLPSGIGAREFVIVATLTSMGVPRGSAFGLALVSRLLFTVADVGAAGAAAVEAMKRLGLKSGAGRAQQPVTVSDRQPG